MTSFVASKCLGRQQCSFQVSALDSVVGLNSTKPSDRRPCPVHAQQYLEASYTCVQGSVISGCGGSSSGCGGSSSWSSGGGSGCGGSSGGGGSGCGGSSSGSSGGGSGSSGGSVSGVSTVGHIYYDWWLCV